MRKLLLSTALIAMQLNAPAQQIQLIKDITINGFTESSHPEIMGRIGNTLIFKADNDFCFGTELWTSDGTPGGTNQVAAGNNSKGIDIYHSANIVVNNKMYFVATDDLHGNELWVTDGTYYGTKMVKDIVTGISVSSMNHSQPQTFRYLNGNIYFTARTQNEGEELWKTDGTEAGTKMVKDIYAGNFPSNPTSLTIADGRLYFIAEIAYRRTRLFSTDGTEAGTNEVNGMNPNNLDLVYNIVEYNNKLYVSGEITANGMGHELYVVEGNTLKLVKDIATGGTDSRPRNFKVVGNKLYFTASTPTESEELWVTDGTSNGTRIVSDIFPGDKLGYIPEIKGVIGDKIIMAADDGVHGWELWMTDGTAAGTKMIKDINPGKDMSMVSINSDKTYANGYVQGGGYVYEGVCYFAANDGVNGVELWRTDGTAEGTYMVENVGVHPDNSASCELEYMYADGANLWLSMTDGLGGVELYKYVMPKPTGLSSTQVVNEISVSPNPARDNIQVRLGSNSFNNGYLKVTDITGRMVYDQSIAPNAKHISVPLSNQPAGVYIVTVNLDNRISSEKLVIE